MAIPVSSSISIAWASVRNVTVTTASATTSGQFAAGTVAVRVCCPAALFINLIASASISGAGQVFLPANTPIIFDAEDSMTLSFQALTSANNMLVNIAPLCS